MRLSQPRTTASESRQHRFESAFKNGVLDLLCDLSLDGSYENRSGKPQWKTAVEKHPARCFTNVTFAFFCPKAAVKLRFKILSSKLRLND
jgi:hypothetical protein